MNRLITVHSNNSVLGILILLTAMSGCGEKIDVKSVHPHRGAIRESFTETAQTRLEKTYLITMPVSGRIGRIDLEPGDAVEAGQELVHYDLTPFEQDVEEARASVAELEASITVNEYNKLEETAKIETQAIVESTQEVVKASKAQVEAERVRSDRASKELDRIQKLAKEKSVTQSQLDDAQLDTETSLIELRKQEFIKTAMNAIFTAVQLGPRYVEEFLGRKQLQRSVLTHQLAQAKARLALAEHDRKLASIASPIHGVVLERYDLGDRTLQAGQEILQLGDLNQLEVIADVLTQDALRIQPGSEVRMEASMGLPPIQGTVKRIEPSGFTKLSSLGVEQQRVNVIVSFDEKPERLGVGYQLQAQFFTDSKEGVIIFPRSCVMQDIDQSHFVFLIEDGVLHKKTVRVGLRNDLEIEVINGMTEQDAVVLYPDATMKEGMSVRILE